MCEKETNRLLLMLELLIIHIIFSLFLQLKSSVGEVMSAPAITLSAEKTVLGLPSKL